MTAPRLQYVSRASEPTTCRVAACTLRRIRAAVPQPTASGSFTSSPNAFCSVLSAPAIARANATNSRASRACDTGKLVASRSCVSSADTSTRTAIPRRSGEMSACAVPLAFDSRTTAGYCAPARTKPDASAAGSPSSNRSRAFSTPSTALAWKARSTPCAPLLFRFTSCTCISCRASSSKTTRSASGLPPSYLSYCV